jgi:hypothetical protein
MREMGYDATNTDFGSLQLLTARNNMFDLETGAIQVTEKTIGHLAITFTTEIRQKSDLNRTYYIFVPLKRGDEVERKAIERGDWLVMLRGEIHIFPDFLFRHTFTTDELIEFRCTKCGKISGDNQDGPYGEKHNVVQPVFIAGQGLMMRSELEDCNMDERV